MAALRSRAGARRNLSRLGAVVLTAVLSVPFATATATEAVPNIDPPSLPCLIPSGTPSWDPFVLTANDDTFTRENWDKSDPGDATWTSLNVPARTILDNDTQEVIDVVDDPPDDAKVALYAGPSHASSFFLNQDGSFHYKSTAGYYGADSFQYVWYVGGQKCSTGATVTIAAATHVRAQDDSFFTYTNTTLSQPIAICSKVNVCGVLDNDLNITGHTQVARVWKYIFGPGQANQDSRTPIGPGSQIDTAHGKVTVNANGTFSYTPTTGYKGPDNFWYTPEDWSTGSGVLGLAPHCRDAGPGCPEHRGNETGQYALVNITVTDPPPPIVAQGIADSVNATEDTLKVIDPATLLANDINASKIIYVQHSFFQADSLRTDHGTLTIHYADLIPGFPSRYVSSIDYTPDADYTGPDWFQYFVATGYANGWDVSDYTGTVAINVAAVADPPHAATDSGNTAFGTSMTIDVVSNDTDPENDINLASLGHDPDPCENQPQHIPSCDNGGDPSGWNNLAHGTWQPNTDGTLTYTPTAGFIGNAIWPYQICDVGARCDQATVVVRVSSVGDDSYNATEDIALNIPVPGVLWNDKPGVAATLGTTTAHGTLGLNANGSFTYTPAANFNGTDSFTYTIGTADTATVTIHVTPKNDPPNLFLNGYCDHSIPFIVCLTEDERDIVEGGTAVLNGSITDPEFESGTLTIHWGDGTQTDAAYPCVGVGCVFGTTPTYSSLCVGACGSPIYFHLTHRYADDPAGASPYVTIDGMAVDAHDGVGTKTTGARVSNVPPTLTVSPEGCDLCVGSYSNLSVALGDQSSVAGKIVDPGFDTGTLTIDWGDGSSASTVDIGCFDAADLCPTPFLQSQFCGLPGTLGLGCGYFSVPHTYAQAGDFTVHLTATDDDGGTATAEVPAHVEGSGVAPIVAPTAQITGVATYRNTRSVPLSWTATAGSAAVTTYDVRYRRAPWNGSFGGFITWQAGTALTGLTFTGAAGSTYCFSVIAHAADGGVSAATPETCTIIPLDERSFTRTGSWSRGTASKYYQSTYTRSSSSGATLKRTGVYAKRIAIVVTTCPTCGKVRVYWGSTLLKTVSLKSTTTVNKKVITIKTFTSVKYGTLRLRVYGSGHRVLIDGVAIGRR